MALLIKPGAVLMVNRLRARPAFTLIQLRASIALRLVWPAETEERRPLMPGYCGGSREISALPLSLGHSDQIKAGLSGILTLAD
jgi:hypothetical protein